MRMIISTKLSCECNECGGFFLTRSILKDYKDVVCPDHGCLSDNIRIMSIRDRVIEISKLK